MVTQEKQWWVYIVLTKKGRFYTGISTDVERRFLEHKHKKGAKFFRTDDAQKIVYRERCENRSVASIREAEIKTLRHEQKRKMIESATPC